MKLRTQKIALNAVCNQMITTTKIVFEFKKNIYMFEWYTCFVLSQTTQLEYYGQKTHNFVMLV